MKKFMTYAFALLMAATAIVSCKPGETTGEDDPIVGPQPGASVPEPDAVAGKYLVIVKFNAEVCNDVVFTGTYNEWATDAAECLKFEPYLGGEKFGDGDFKAEDGWMYVLFEDESESVQGKPVQLKNDGSFSWDYQCGDADAWTIHSGAVTLEPGFAGEVDLKGYSAVTVAEMKYWKNEGSPCNVKEVKYNITLKCPVSPTPVQIIGGFEGWTGIDMDKVSDTEYKIEVAANAGAEYKFRNSTDWSSQLQYWAYADTDSAQWKDFDNLKLTEELNVVCDFSDATKYHWTNAE